MTESSQPWKQPDPTRPVMLTHRSPLMLLDQPFRKTARPLWQLLTALAPPSSKPCHYRKLLSRLLWMSPAPRSARPRSSVWRRWARSSACSVDSWRTQCRVLRLGKSRWEIENKVRFSSPCLPTSNLLTIEPRDGTLSKGWVLVGCHRVQRISCSFQNPSVKGF